MKKVPAIRPHSDRLHSDRPHSDRPHSDRPHSDRPRARTRTQEPESVRPSRRPRNADATREVLLATAEVVFTELGFDGARVDDIAGRANVNKRMIYVYFGDKLGLYGEVLRSAFARITRRAKATFDASGNPRENLTQWIRGYFELLAQHPQFVRLIEWEALGDGSRSASTLRDVAQKELAEFTDLLEKGVASGQFRADASPHMTLMAIHSMCFGVLTRRRLWSSLWQLDLDHPSVIASVSQFLADLVLGGISISPQTGTP